MGIGDVLAAARSGVGHLTPQQAADAARRGALLVDTRTDEDPRVVRDVRVRAGQVSTPSEA